MKWTVQRIPVLVGPQIPRKDRSDTHERYCRAILTLFRPWSKVTDLCRIDQSWADAFLEHEKDFDDATKSIINNIEALHECKSDREKYLTQILNDEEIDDIILQNDDNGAFKYDDEFAEVDDDDEDNLVKLFELHGKMNERLTNSGTNRSVEDLYIDNTLKAISCTNRFVPKNNVDYTHLSFTEQIAPGKSVFI